MQVVTYNALVGYEIKKLRDEMKLDQMALSKMAGISQPVLSRLEKGQASITVDQLFVICRALDENPQNLVGRVFQSVIAIDNENSVELATSKSADFSTGALLTGAALGAVLALLLSRK